MLLKFKRSTHLRIEMRVKHLVYALNLTNKMSLRLKYHKNLARVSDFNIFNLNYIIESRV